MYMSLLPLWGQNVVNYWCDPYIYVIDEKGKCFYNEHSWFVHKNYHKGKNEVKNKNKEVFEKIFGMMDDIKPWLIHAEIDT